MAVSSRRTRQSIDFWPGYVDGLAGLLMIMLFLLLFYVLGELALSTALDDSKRDSQSKSSIIDELMSQLSVSQNENVQLRDQIESHRTDIDKLLEFQQRNLNDLEIARTRIQALLTENLDLGRQISENEALYLALRSEYDQLAIDANARDTANSEQIDTLTANLNQAQQSLDETEERRILLLSQLNQLRTDSAVREQALTREREEIRVSLSETIAVQADRILVLEQSLKSAQEKNTQMASNLDSLSEDKLLLVGRVTDLETLERERLEVLTNLNADIQALSSLREQLQDQLNAQADILNEKERSLQQSFAEMRLLNQQILALNAQLEQVNNILAVREQTIDTQKIEIAGLGSRLNMVMASEISRLQRYRSDFFGRMRALLADRPEVKVVDDRFILQSEVLFDSSSAKLTQGGKQELQVIALLLKDLLSEVPDDLPWLLRVDGHTDTRPINTPQFPSNWELSASRAIAVVRYLNKLGIPNQNLAPTGFADQHPIETRDDEIAHRRNRRIEMKLTQR